MKIFGWKDQQNTYLLDLMLLESPDILLRALEPSDVESLFEWENDRNNWRVSHTISPFSRHLLMQYIDSINDIYTDKQLRLMITTKSEGKAIGTIDLFDCDFLNHRAGIGILIANENDRNHGWTSQAIQLIIEYAFQELSLHQLFCGINKDNLGSIALFEKFGFISMGIRKDWNYFKGQFSDEIMFQLINGKA